MSQKKIKSPIQHYNLVVLKTLRAISSDPKLKIGDFAKSIGADSKLVEHAITLLVRLGIVRPKKDSAE